MGHGTGSEAALRPDARIAPAADSVGVDASGVGARRGLSAELTVLIAAVRPQLLRLAYRFCWNWADAEDAVQDALLLATQRIEQLADAGRLAPWVKSIVVRQSIERVRRRPREAAAEILAASAISRSEVGEGESIAPRLKLLISALPERQQAALVLREISGMEYSEVAAILEIEESTARVLVRNGREGLRAMLQREVE